MKNFVIISVISLGVTLFEVGSYMQVQAAQQAIRDIVDERYPGGNVLVGGNFNTAWLEETLLPLWDIMKKEFSFVTSGSNLTQFNIHPTPTKWVSHTAELWPYLIEDGDMILRAHAPISPQCSRWVKEDNRTPQELEQIMTEYISTLYPLLNENPRVEYVEVINEAVVNGEWHGPKPGNTEWENPWAIIGIDPDGVPSYIRMAIALAVQYAPDKKILWNQNGPLRVNDWELISQTVYQLLSEGYRIDAIGWQAHLRIDQIPINSNWENVLRGIIRETHAAGLEFHITEIDVLILDPNDPVQLQMQAEIYKAILEVVMDFRDTGVVGFTLWSVFDSINWRQDYYPGIFDEDLQPKPAYDEIVETLRGN